MVQCQFLNYILSTKDLSILQKNNITPEYFLEYSEEIKFILDHKDKYGQVPDTETFMAQFNNFDLVEVKESERYLVDTLREEYLYSQSVPIIQHAAKLLQTDANEAAVYLQSQIQTLSPHYSTPAVDIIHSDSRVKLFEDKMNNPDKWFIPTGFEELDDIIGGWQQGEEYVVFFARTNQGKSWIVCKVAQHAWLMGKNVGYVSPEMSADKIGYRFDTLNQHLSNKALVRGDSSVISLNDYQQYLDDLKKRDTKFLVATPVDFDKKITVTKLRSFVLENKLDMLIVDGITYMTDERYKRGDNKTTTLTNISEDLMQLSCELSIPIIVVVQSNRGGIKEVATDTPSLEDIRDSDGISHNATKVISLKQHNGALLMEIKKNRDGALGEKLTYMWDIDTGEFTYTSGVEDSVDYERKETVKNELKSKHKKEGKVVF